MSKTIYFDISGVFLDQQDVAQEYLIHSNFEKYFFNKFTQAVCVSGWIEDYHSRGFTQTHDLKLLICGLLSPIIKDSRKLYDMMEIRPLNQGRWESINTKEDWYWVDDEAIKYAGTKICADNTNRIFIPKIESKGSDIQKWLLSI